MIPSLPLLSHWRSAELLSADPAAQPWPEIAPFYPESHGAHIKATWDHNAVRFLALISSGTEMFSVFLDPVGDGEAYFEIGVNSQNAVFSRAVRRNRSGLRVDSSWQCEELVSVVHANEEGWSAALVVPFACLGSVRPGPGWRIGFREVAQWSGFRPPSRFFPLTFQGK